MKAAVESVKQTGEVTSHGPTMSVNFNGFTVAFAHSETEFTSLASHNIYSTITAPNVVIEVGGDLTLRGAYVSGKKVDVHVDRQLIIESIKDVNTAESESSSVSLGVSVNWAGQFAPSVSVSASDSMQNSELVHFISGISGADVKVVAETIKLKGAEIFGTEKLNVQGVVTTEDVEEIKESSSSHMGFSFDPIKGQGLTSINFDIGEKHDNGVVHSGVGAEASHEQTDKGGYTLSLLGNNVLVRGFKEAYNWLTEPKPVANDWTPPAPQESEMNEKEKPEEKQPEEKSEPKAEKPEQKAKQPEFSSEKIERELAEKYGQEDVKQAKENSSKRLAKIAELESYKVENGKIIIELPKEVKVAGMAGSLDLNGYKIALQIISESEALAIGAQALKFGKYFVRVSGPVGIALTVYEIGKFAYDHRGVLEDAVTFTKNLMTEAINKGTIISTPIHEQTKPDTTGFPEHKEESTDRGFTPWDGSEYKDKGFTPVDVDTKIPGFEMPDSIDTSILMNEVSRHGAFNDAKQDAGIPRNQQPDEVRNTAMKDKFGQNIKDQNGQVIFTKEYIFVKPDGAKIAIQDHSAGHQFGEGGVGDQGAHFNVRGFEEDGITIDRNSKIPGTKPHYPFNK